MRSLWHIESVQYVVGAVFVIAIVLPIPGLDSVNHGLEKGDLHLGITPHLPQPAVNEHCLAAPVVHFT